MSRSAENRRCPQCDRKSALKFISDEYGFGNACRWSDCGYERIHIRGGSVAVGVAPEEVER